MLMKTCQKTCIVCPATGCEFCSLHSCGWVNGTDRC